MFGDCWSNGIRQQRSQFGMRSFFVAVHQSRIASYVSG
jgi:hypothetical protein